MALKASGVKFARPAGVQCAWPLSAPGSCSSMQQFTHERREVLPLHRIISKLDAAAHACVTNPRPSLRIVSYVRAATHKCVTNGYVHTQGNQRHYRTAFHERDTSACSMSATTRCGFRAC